MQVYVLETHGKIDHGGAFVKLDDIRESLRISYCNCLNVTITMHPRSSNGPSYVVTGERGIGADNETFRDEFIVHRIPVWDGPTHL